MIVWRLQPPPSAWWAPVASGENIHNGSSSFRAHNFVVGSHSMLRGPAGSGRRFELLGADRWRTNGDPSRWQRQRAGWQVLHSKPRQHHRKHRVGPNAKLTVLAYTEPSSIGGDIEAKNCKGVGLVGNLTSAETRTATRMRPLWPYPHGYS
jgi:hypothetical protein